ncbi:MAG: sortase [Acidimicrobiaceae bacterium]
MTSARVLGAIGRVMITAGVLILLFVVYQLYGTGIRERQAQDRLERRFNTLIQGNGDGSTVGGTASSTTSTTTGPSGPTTSATLPPVTAPSEGLSVAEGDPVGKIDIPKIGLTAYLVEGVAVDDLKEGPGHYPETPFPGQKGNAAVAGHRTTYGAPFASVDELALGDKIVVTTLQGTFTYGVTGSEIVTPDKVEVLNDFGDNRITLTACHPKYDLSHRIIVTGTLEGQPAPTPTLTPEAVAARQTVNLDLSGKSAPKLPAILYGLVCAAIWLAAWLLAGRWKKWPSYLVGLPFFLVALFFFFENFSRLLPSNY